VTRGGRIASALAATALVFAVASAVLATTAVPAGAAGFRTAKVGRLVAFKSCGALLDYTQAQAGRFVSPYGIGVPVATTSAVTGKAGTAPVAAAAASATGASTGSSASGSSSAATSSTPQEGVDYSGTNNQEAGVDEPDIVKTDGKTLFAVADGYVDAVDVTSHTPTLLGSLKLTDGGWTHELLLHGTHLLILSKGGYWATPLPALVARVYLPQQSQSVLTDVDVSNPRAMHVISTLTLDGAYVDARMVGGVVRVVSSSGLGVDVPTAGPVAFSTAGLAAAKAKNAAAVQSAPVRSWLPTYSLKKRGRVVANDRPLVQCRDVSRPALFSGLGMLTVSTIDLDTGLDPVDSTSIMTDGRIVYASQSNLYVTTESWNDRPLPSAPESIQSGVSTTINVFDISSPTKTVYLGSGSVPGYLLDSYSMSEFQGALRVVSTQTPAWWGPGGSSQSFITALKMQNGSLNQVGQVSGLGQDERVYAVRFVGDTGYVVTFRQVDPLYTVDLSDPTHPQVLGELTLPGYSAYLHPIGDNLLLGIGQDVDPATNEPTGTQISLFDVSDLKNPKRLQETSLGRGWSEAESDFHAFLWWPTTSLLMVPFQQQALGFKVNRASGIQQLGTVTHQNGNLNYLPQINRSVIVGDSVLTVSDAGVESSAISTLAPQGWVSFPAAPSGPILPGPISPFAGTGAASTGKAVPAATAKH
jgi:uncharacterized secreted protein with C-terminal beta-propeller domain